jgi:ankyrin repeat protein
LQQPTAAIENKLASFMYKYRSRIAQQIWRFADPRQQEDVFQAMVSTADGLTHKDHDTGMTLLHYMAMNGVADILQIMVDAGFDVKAQDSDNMNPLHLAVVGSHADAVHILIEICVVDVHARDVNNALPWHVALRIDSDYV